MNRNFYSLFLMVITCTSIATAQTGSRGSADYKMEISLDTDEKTISGVSEITWTNPSEKEVGELQFHLYYNAFKNTASTFMKNRDEFGFLMKSLEEECGWSYSDIIELRDSAGNDLLEQAKFIAPDDGNEADQTVLKVILKESVPSRQSRKYSMKWKAKIPKAMIRTGYNQDYYFFAQWFPKLGVYEPAGMRYEEEGAWSCHQYHASGEYYGEFGDYEVKLTVPADFIVGASGELVNSEVSGDSKSWVFKADNVIDFSWTCSPEFVLSEDYWQDVALKLYAYPGHEDYTERYFTTAKQSLEYMAEHVGEYPYSTLTMVDPPIHGLFTGGMEYPTFISSISATFLPKGIKAPETLIVHEFVHQYFMQMVATHEQEEPWMDEGITTYYEGRILDEYYGTKTSLLDVDGIQLGNREYNRYEYWASPNPQIADNSFKARDFVHGGYSPIAYNKTAMMLKTLEGILGLDKMDAIMKSYFEQWKFNHPCGLDFIQVFKDNLSESYLKERKFDLDLFFDQALYGTEVCDYAIMGVVSEEEQWKGGFLDDNENCLPYKKAGSSILKQKVIVERLGDMILPVDIEINFEDGTSQNFLWDGVKRSEEFLLQSSSKIVKVQIDPEYKLNLERNVINNSLLASPSTAYKKYTSRFKVGVQHFLDFLNFLS